MTLFYIPKKGALNQEKASRLAIEVARDGDRGPELRPKEAHGEPASITVNSLKSVVVGDTECRERRPADSQEKYADEQCEGERGSLVRVTEVGTQEIGECQVPEHSSRSTTRVKATIGVNLSPDSADREGSRGLQGAYGAEHGIYNVLIAHKDGKAEVDSSARGGV